MLRLLLLLFSFFYINTTSLARPIPVPNHIPTDVAVSDIDVELYTVGLGPALYMRYGHTLLGFHVKSTGARLIYNWGMFDFQDPLFPIHFYLGKRTYWVGQSSLEGVVRLYKDYEDRNVWRDIINLTEKQKTELIRLVNEKLSAENMFFGYEHFERNCATIPRDLINDSLGQILSKNLKAEPADHDFRWYVRTHLGIVPSLGWILDIAMNNKLDVPQSKWEESFYPIKLREYAASLPSYNDDGTPNHGQNLLQFDKQLVKASSDWFQPDPNFYIYVTGFLFAVTVIILFFPIPVLTGLSSVFLGGVFGIIGFSMIISWVFSTHFDMHHNINMLLFFPVDLILIFLPKWKQKPWFRNYVICHWILLGVHISVSLLGISNQNALRVIPVGIAYSIWMSVASGWLIFKGKSFHLRIP